MQAYSKKSSSSTHETRFDNQLLDNLDEATTRRLTPHLELVDLPRGEIVCASGRTMTHAHFPTTCIISLLHVLEDGATAESAVVGKEGMLSVTLFMGGSNPPYEATIQNDGYAWRLPAEALVREFNASASLRNRLLRYTQALFAQTSQTAICNRHHTVQQQLCRRLLLTLDRLQGNEMYMTQEQIAGTLGVRREGISEAAGRLQLMGLIRYRRGRITVLDRDLLEEQACECYEVVRQECERIENMPEPPRRFLPFSIERRSRVRPPPPE